MEYAVGAIPIEATCAGAEHRRARYYFVADADDQQRRLEQQQQKRAPERAWGESCWPSEGVALGDAACDDERRPGISDGTGPVATGGLGAGDGLEWVIDNKGKARRAPSGIRMLATGLSGHVAVDGSAGKTLISRVATLKGFGNALDQRAARAFVASCMDFLVPLFIATLLAVMAAAAIMGSGGAPIG